MSRIVILCLAVAVAHADQYYGGYNEVSGYGDYYAPSSYYSNITSSPANLKRTFNTISSDNPFVFVASFTLKVPITDLDTTLSLGVPFSFDFPTAASSRASSGRSFARTERTDVYSTIEKYIETTTGINGKACLLRAVCEVGSTPDHHDGLMGDAVTMLLTATRTINAINHESGVKEYVEAQAQGQVSGDCSKYFASCPMSFFNLVAE